MVFAQRLLQWIIVALLLLVCSVGQGLAQAPEASGTQLKGFFVDPTGKMTLDEIKAQYFKPYGGALSLGFTSDTVWLKLGIDSGIDLDDDFNSNFLILRLSNPLLNDVRLYDPQQNDGQAIITGDANPNLPNELPWPSLTFLIPRTDVPRDVYVSINSTNSLVFSVVLDSVKNAIRHNQTYNLYAGLYLGLLFVFFILAVGLRVGSPDQVINMFIIQQALAVAWSLSLMGYTRQYLGPMLGLHSVDSFVNFVIAAYTFSVGQFGLLFLSQFKLRSWAKKLIYLPIAFFIPILIAMLFGNNRVALYLNAISIMVITALGMLCALIAIDWKAASSRVFPRGLVIFFYALFGLATPIATSVTLRVDSFFQNAFVGLFFTTAAAGAFMSSLFLYRARNQASELMLTSMALSLQKQRSQEQAKFISMLAHEFKTPLSIISMVVGSGQLDARSWKFSEEAIHNINALLEKCLQAEAMIDEPTISDSVVFSIDELVREVITNYAHQARIDINSECPIEIRSDPMLCKIIINNLIDNAVKYGAPCEPVKITIRLLSSDTVSVRVSNRVGSAGLPDPKRLFEKYYRSAAALNYSGSGLGVYLSKHIARLLDGDLLCEIGGSEVSFEVTLPK